jgi:hypothetical protein
MAWPSSLSSWRTCPNVNARKNDPSVDGAGIQPPSSRPVRPGAQHARVVNAVGAEHHRKQQRHHLAPRVRGARPIAPQPHTLLRERLNPESPSKRRDNHHPGIADDALVVELDLHAVQSDRLVILHHEGDLLFAGPGCPTQP